MVQLFEILNTIIQNSEIIKTLIKRIILKALDISNHNRIIHK